jgi:hypothetical protein
MEGNEMGYFFFDNPTGAIALAVILEMILLIGWACQRQKVKTRILLVGPLLIVLSLLLDWSVTTNREKLEKNTIIIVQAAQDEDPQTIINLLSDKFMLSNGLGKIALSGILLEWFSKPLIMSNRINELMVTWAEPTHGTVEFTVTTVIDPESPYGLYGRFVTTEWRFDYQCDADGEYRLVSFEMLRMDGQEPIDIFTIPRL